MLKSCWTTLYWRHCCSGPYRHPRRSSSTCSRGRPRWCRTPASASGPARRTCRTSCWDRGGCRTRSSSAPRRRRTDSARSPAESAVEAAWASISASTSSFQKFSWSQVFILGKHVSNNLLDEDEDDSGLLDEEDDESGLLLLVVLELCFCFSLCCSRLN